jgi:HD-GYP domain-containing protein (c-di-GMP phosphodiesterase class II)
VLISTLFGQAMANLARARELQEAERSMKEQYDIIANLSNTVMNSAMDLKDYSEGARAAACASGPPSCTRRHVDTIYMLAVAARQGPGHRRAPAADYPAHEVARRRDWAYDDDEADRLAYAGVLHDVGKMHVPDHI